MWVLSCIDWFGVVGFVILSAILNRVHRDLICERKRKRTGSGRYQGTGSERAALTG